MKKFKLDHLNLTVSNIEQSLEWYERVFQMEVAEQGLTADARPWAIIKRNDSMLCISENKNRRLATKDEKEQLHQIFHFGFRVPDEQAWREVVKENKLKLYYGGVVNYPRSKSWYIIDPDNYMIEVSYCESDELLFEDTI